MAEVPVQRHTATAYRQEPETVDGANQRAVYATFVTADLVHAGEQSRCGHRTAQR